MPKKQTAEPEGPAAVCPTPQKVWPAAKGTPADYDPEGFLDLLTAARANSKRWRQGKTTWVDFLLELDAPADHKECGGYVFGRFRDGFRDTEHLVDRCAVTLDADYAAPDFVDRVRALGYQAAWHTTWRHTPGAPRWRVILPTARRMTADEYRATADALMNRLGREQFDPVSADPVQFMWRPSARDVDTYDYGWQDGALLGVDGPEVASPERKAPVDIPALIRDGIPVGEQDNTLVRVTYALALQGAAEDRARATWWKIVEASEQGGEPYTDADFDRHWQGAVKKAALRRSSAADDFAVSDFFDRTKVLQHIRTAAHSRLLSAPMLLMQVLARVLLEVPPGWLLPAVVGSAASINVGFAGVGRSSAGKSSSQDVAGELLDVNQEVMIKGVGSGEGMIDAFHHVEKVNGKNEMFLNDKPHLLLTVDEVETLDKLLGRSGSTTGPLLRTALSGGTLSTTNAAAGGRSRHLPRHEYRLVVVVAIQPALSGVLLDGGGAGLPQRFLWFGGKDSTLPQQIADLPDWPGTLTWDTWWQFQNMGSRTIDYPEHVKDEIKQDRLLVGGDDDADPLKGHLMLTRLKIAAALAILHQNLDITDQWWELAGELTDASVKMQEYCRVVLAEDAATRSDQKARQIGRSKVAETNATEVELARRKSVADNILAKVAAAGPDGVAWGKVRGALPQRNRQGADQVRDQLLASGQLRSEEIDHHGQQGMRLYSR